jgi:hypothetical protein
MCGGRGGRCDVILKGGLAARPDEDMKSCACLVFDGESFHNILDDEVLVGPIAGLAA